MKAPPHSVGRLGQTRFLSLSQLVLLGSCEGRHGESAPAALRPPTRLFRPHAPPAGRDNLLLVRQGMGGAADPQSPSGGARPISPPVGVVQQRQRGFYSEVLDAELEPASQGKLKQVRPCASPGRSAASAWHVLNSSPACARVVGGAAGLAQHAAAADLCRSEAADAAGGHFREQ